MERPAGRWLRAGLVGRPHGLDGSFHVREPTPRLLDVGVRVMVDGRELTISRRAGNDRRPIVRLEGHEDRSAAEALGGSELLVQRDDAPALDADEWWAEDLEGCAVYDGERLVGTVGRLLALPSVDALVVVRSGGHGELIVPLVSDAVREVDVEHRRIDVDLRFLGLA
jgi:16S rRNA processing protein RimM